MDSKQITHRMGLKITAALVVAAEREISRLESMYSVDQLEEAYRGSNNYPAASEGFARINAIYNLHAKCEQARCGAEAK